MLLRAATALRSTRAADVQAPGGAVRAFDDVAARAVQ